MPDYNRIYQGTPGYMCKVKLTHETATKINQGPGPGQTFREDIKINPNPRAGFIGKIARCQDKSVSGYPDMHAR